MTTSDLTLIIKKMSEANDKAIREFGNGLQGVISSYISKDTNSYTYGFKSPTDMIRALEKSKQFPQFIPYTVSPYLMEVYGAIENRDFFKAYTLCVTLYEAYGKEILISQFKDKSTLAEDIADKLYVSHIIDLLHKHGMIEDKIRSQMFSVIDTRNDLAHRYFSQISPELSNEMEQNIPKIRKTLETLKGMHDKLPKE